MFVRARVVRALLAVALLVAGLAVVGGPADAGPAAEGSVVVANRASGTISVIDVATDQVVETKTLPGDNPAEPMYVVAVGRRVFVGDRANNQVVVYDKRTWDVIDTVPAGNGVFHMWADPQARQLWVNNDIDNTITVIDPRDLTVIDTVPLPADLVALGGKPHDVILDRDAAYVTMLGIEGPNDYVVKYRRWTMNEVGRAAVGQDPHVTLNPNDRRLYVATQNSDEVSILKRTDLSLIDTVAIPAAHGVDMTADGKVVYVTNITGGGTDGLVAMDAYGRSVIGSADTPYPIPHNVVLNRQQDKLYVTHSGATADKVTIYEVSRANPVPVFLGEVTVGLNPFGLDYVR